MHPCADHPVDPNGDTAPAAGGYVGWPVSPGHLPDPHRDMDQGRVAIFFKPLIWFEILNCLYKVKMSNLLWANIPDLAMKNKIGVWLGFSKENLDFTGFLVRSICFSFFFPTLDLTTLDQGEPVRGGVLRAVGPVPGGPQWTHSLGGTH